MGSTIFFFAKGGVKRTPAINHRVVHLGFQFNPHVETVGLPVTLLLTYALRNADCRANDTALLYTSRDDAHLLLVHDMLATVVYAGYQNNPSGIASVTNLPRSFFSKGKTFAVRTRNPPTPWCRCSSQLYRPARWCRA